MNCPFYKSKRHGGILLRAFFILIVLLSAAISQGDPDLLNFQADETGQSAVSFSRFNPFVFSDITSGPIIYDGSLNIPLGSFLMKNMPAIAEPDSIRHLTFFDYSQGDYGLRDITIGEEAHLWSGGSLKFIGMGRSFQGLYNNLGPLNSARNNVLQNYLLQFDRELERSEFSVGFQYHTENGGLPVAPDEYHYRKGESFNLGANYKYLNDSYEIAGRSAIQLGRFDLNGSYNFDSFTTWNDLAATYFYRPGMQFNAGIGRKSLNFEPKSNPVRSNRFTYLNLSAVFQIKSVSLQIGTFFLSKTFHPTFSADWVGKWFSAGIEHRIGNHLGMEMGDEALQILTNQDFPTTMGNLRFNLGGFQSRLSAGIVGWQNNQVPVGTFDIAYAMDWMRISAGGSFTDSDSALYNYTVESVLQISPELKEKRFRPFVTLTAGTVHFPGYRSLDLTSPVLIVHDPVSSYSATRLDFAIGFTAASFRFTYHSKNLLNNELIYSPFIQESGRLNYFQVLWMFQN